MNTMNISLPDSLQSFVDEQVVAGRYRSRSEYIRELIKKDQGTQRLHKLMLEGAGSPQTGVANDDYFDTLRARARRAVQK